MNRNLNNRRNHPETPEMNRPIIFNTDDTGVGAVGALVGERDGSRLELSDEQTAYAGSQILVGIVSQSSHSFFNTVSSVDVTVIVAFASN